jgi:hypothetical protein
MPAMPPIVHKMLLILAALGIAAGITLFPWWMLDKVPDELSNLYGMTAILWAPCALLLGVIACCGFVHKLWPRDGGD